MAWDTSALAWRVSGPSASCQHQQTPPRSVCFSPLILGPCSATCRRIVWRSEGFLPLILGPCSSTCRRIVWRSEGAVRYFILRCCRGGCPPQPINSSFFARSFFRFSARLSSRGSWMRKHDLCVNERRGNMSCNYDSWWSLRVCSRSGSLSKLQSH